MPSSTQHILTVFTAAWIVLGVLGGSAEAQGPRLLEVELTLAPQETVASSTLAALDIERPPQPLRTPVPTSAGYASGRWPLMVGLSLLTAGIGIASLFGTTTCHYPRERYTDTDIPASVSIGLGISLTLAGAIRLARLPGPRRRPRLAGAIVGTVLMSGLTLGLLSLSLLPSWVGCVSS